MAVVALCLGLGCFAGANPSLAGQNADVFADLSWERDAIVGDRSALPLGDFPLYLRLHGVVSATVVGLQMRWFPSTADSACYAMVDGPAADSCGVVVDLPPLSILPDTGYARRIEFTAPPAGEVCLTQWFSYAHCGGIQPGRFHVAALLLEDSEGQRDLVPVINEATILGGAGIEQPSALQSSTSTWLVPGRMNQFHLQGVGLAEITSATLVGADGEVPGTIWSEGDRSLLVSLQVPEDYEGLASLVVGEGGSHVANLPLLVTVADTSAETGDGLNGTGYPFDKPTDGGVWRKHANRSDWEFIPAVPDSVTHLGGQAIEQFLRAHARPARGSGSGRPASRPKEATARPAQRLHEPPSLDFWDVQTLFEETFESPLSTGASGKWRVSTVLGDPGWTRRQAGCSQVFGGSWSGTPGDPLACWGYVSSTTGLLQNTPTSLTGYLRADLGFWRWLDARSGGPTDTLSWWYSIDGGSAWIPVRAGASSLHGEDRVWRRELIQVANPSGTTPTVRLKIDFGAEPPPVFVSPHADSGVFIDDVSIAGVPRPNLTFTKPAGWEAPVVASNTPGDFSNPPLTNGGNSYFSYAIRNNSISAAGPFRVNLAIEQLGIVDDRQVAGMAPGEVRTFTNIARNVPVGSCGDRAAALSIDYESFNAYGAVLEVDESDNSFPASFSWSAPSSPDLRVDQVLIEPPIPCAGEQVTLRTVVINLGSAASPTASLGLATSAFGSAACNSSQIVGAIDALAPGALDTVLTTVTSAVAMTRSYYFKVDCANLVAEGCEFEESNNTFGPTPVTWTPPGADLAVTGLSVSNSSPTVGQSNQIQVRIANVGQASTPSSWSFDWYRDLSAPPASGQAGNLRITVKRAIHPGQDTVITLTRTSPTSGVWRMYARANVTESSPECRRFINNVAGPTLLTWVSDSLLVKGRFTYRDTGYVRAGAPLGSQGFAIHPLRGARVQIMDRQTASADRLLGTTCTDDNGDFALALASRYDPEAGPIDEPQHVVDVYARAVLTADPVCAGIPAVTVRRLTEDTAWVFTGPIRMNVTTNLVDFGEVRPAADYGVRSAMHIYETILDAAQRMRAHGFQPFLGLAGDAPWHAVVRWQSEDGNLAQLHRSITRGDTIWISGARKSGQNTFSPDEWDDHQILHEYGHNLARLGGFDYRRPDGTPDSCYEHGYELALECPPGTLLHGLAWEEGWCHFAATLLDSTPPTSILRDAGFDDLDSLWRFTFDLETGVGHTIDRHGNSPPSFNVNDSGPAFEGANAAALWDWVDAQNDDQNGDGCRDELAEPLEQLLALLPPASVTSESKNDSLVNVYMAYQREYLSADLPRARALFKVLCEHGFWGVGDERDTTEFVDVGGRSRGLVSFQLRPSVTSGSIRFTLSGMPTGSASPPTIEVFDVAGRVLWRRVAHSDGNMPLFIDWDARTDEGMAVRSGVYFARCSLPDRSLIRTLVVRR